MPDDFWRCKKCNTLYKHRELIARQKPYCDYCKEPSLELYDICGLVADWSSGEFSHKPPEDAA